jgi:hypothetical protein
VTPAAIGPSQNMRNHEVIDHSNIIKISFRQMAGESFNSKITEALSGTRTQKSCSTTEAPEDLVRSFHPDFPRIQLTAIQSTSGCVCLTEPRSLGLATTPSGRAKGIFLRAPRSGGPAGAP